MEESITQNVEVRRHNGQCEYGPWIAIRDEDLPSWVIGLIADEIAEDDADEGIVEQGGSAFAWRKGTAAPPETRNARYWVELKRSSNNGPFEAIECRTAATIEEADQIKRDWRGPISDPYWGCGSHVLRIWDREANRYVD